MPRCGACNVVLNDNDDLRSHYSSELHIKNVSRRVEGLRALTNEELRNLGSASEDSAVDGAKNAPLFSCTLCKKSFRSVKTLQAHVRSTAHLMLKEQRILSKGSEVASMLTATSLGTAAMGLHRRYNAKHAALRKRAEEKVRASQKTKVGVEDREKDTDETRCLFCGYASIGFAENLEHLRRTHNFFIPIARYCSDVHGLLAYLSRKVNGLVCLVCNEKTRSFSSLSALRDHMREADHEKIVLSHEYQEFYSCPLDDPSAGASSILNSVQDDEIVLPLHMKGDEGAKKRVLKKRESQVPRPRPCESLHQAEQRHMILASKHEEAAIARREYHQLAATQERLEAKLVKQYEGDFNKQQLKVHLRTNKLHPKGYDGEGKLN